MGAFCRGLDVTLEFDPRAWQVGGLFLLASVLERFLALHATINSFTRTRAVLRGRPGNAGDLAGAQRNPRAGMSSAFASGGAGADAAPVWLRRRRARC